MDAAAVLDSVRSFRNRMAAGKHIEDEISTSVSI